MYVDDLKHFVFMTLFSVVLDSSVRLLPSSIQSDFDFWELGELFMDYDGKILVWLHKLCNNCAFQ